MLSLYWSSSKTFYLLLLYLLVKRTNTERKGGAGEGTGKWPRTENCFSYSQARRDRHRDDKGKCSWARNVVCSSVIWTPTLGSEEEFAWFPFTPRWLCSPCWLHVGHASVSSLDDSWLKGNSMVLGAGPWYLVSWALQHCPSVLIRTEAPGQLTQVSSWNLEWQGEREGGTLPICCRNPHFKCHILWWLSITLLSHSLL